MEISTTANRTKFLTFFVVLVLAILSLYFYRQYRAEQAQNPAREVEETVAAVSELMELPAGETPTLATVTEREKLTTQTFFKYAENGDKVLIYLQSRRAILYRPSSNKIIDVTTINTDASVRDVQPNAASKTTLTEPAKSIAPQSTPTISLFNGTTTEGITTAIQSQITSTFPTLAVVEKETAAFTDYAVTLVIDLSGKNQAAAQSLATALSATLSTLPEGEKIPTGDIVVIVGGDKVPAAQ